MEKVTEENLVMGELVLRECGQFVQILPIDVFIAYHYKNTGYGSKYSVKYLDGVVQHLNSIDVCTYYKLNSNLLYILYGVEQ